MPDNKININAENNYAFINSCYYGHLEIVKLLTKTGKVNNGLINAYCDNYDKETLKLIFDMNYKPLNDKMEKEYELHVERKKLIKQEINEKILPELEDLIYNYE